MAVSCTYCSKPTLRMTGSELHPSRSDLANKHYHVCRNCDAWIGCKGTGWEPSGRLANAQLRRAKQDAHAALEPIWQQAMAEHGWTKSKARNLAYKWIANELDLGPGRPQIGEFDLRQCELVTSICRYRDPDLYALSEGGSKNGQSKRNWQNQKPMARKRHKHTSIEL